MGGYNGSGTYIRYYNWTNDANASIKIRADRMDTEDNGFATGLSNCITKDGQQTVTANIPFAGFKLTNIGNATVRTDAANGATVQDQQFINATGVSGTNTITFSTVPAFTSYVAGQTFRVTIAVTNTGAVTANGNGVGAIAVKKKSLAGLVAVAANDLIAGQEYDFYYDGTQFQVSGSNLDATVASTYAPLASPTFTGTPSLPTGTTAITQTANNNSTKIATTAYTDTADALRLLKSSNLSDLSNVATALTNLGFASNVTGTTGHIVIPGTTPIYIQWGRTASINSASSGTTNFDTAFPTQGDAIIYNPVTVNANWSSSPLTAFGTTSFTITNQTASAQVFHYIAIGH